jgi:hypothetical protein
MLAFMYPLFLSDFTESSVFSKDFLKIIKYISWKTFQWGAEFFHTDERTDRHDRSNSRFSHFSKAPKK